MTGRTYLSIKTVITNTQILTDIIIIKEVCDQEKKNNLNDNIEEEDITLI